MPRRWKSAHVCSDDLVVRRQTGVQARLNSFVSPKWDSVTALILRRRPNQLLHLLYRGQRACNMPSIPFRTAVLLVALSGAGVRPLKSQTPDRTLSSMVGGALGGLGGILVALPVGCGPVFSNSTCKLPTVVKGFAVGNVLGSAFGAAHSPNMSSCSLAERYGRSLIGTVAGAGIGVAAVSRAHGDLRLGLAPFVQLAEGLSAAAMLNPCAQRRAGLDSDATPSVGECHNPSRNLARAVAAVGLPGGFAALHVYFHHAWWSGTPAKNWFVENDWGGFNHDADKFGHFFGGYQLTRISSELLLAGCVQPSRAALWGALYSYAFAFQVKEWDGTQQMYGFNPSDLMFDVAGEVFAVAQQHTKVLQAIKPVFSYRPTEAYRTRNEPGHGGQPRPSTDYSGQTYWFSTDVNALLPDRAKPFWPAIIRFSPGFSITDYIDPRTGAGLKAKRRIFLSLDLDPEHLPGDNKVWRTVKHELSFLRIPGPTLQITPATKFVGAHY
jgi:Predicted periplasmic lipoprotein (DUF2279)